MYGILHLVSNYEIHNLSMLYPQRNYILLKRPFIWFGWFHNKTHFILKVLFHQTWKWWKISQDWLTNEKNMSWLADNEISLYGMCIGKWLCSSIHRKNLWFYVYDIFPSSIYRWVLFLSLEDKSVLYFQILTADIYEDRVWDFISRVQSMIIWQTKKYFTNSFRKLYS